MLVALRPGNVLRNYRVEETIAYVLIEKSERRAATGARNNPNQNTDEDSNICDIPAILAPNGKLGQKWLRIEAMFFKQIVSKKIKHMFQLPVEYKEEEPCDYRTTNGQQW